MFQSESSVKDDDIIFVPPVAPVRPATIVESRLSKGRSATGKTSQSVTSSVAKLSGVSSGKVKKSGNLPGDVNCPLCAKECGNQANLETHLKWKCQFVDRGSLKSGSAKKDGGGPSGPKGDGRAQSVR